MSIAQLLFDYTGDSRTICGIYIIGHDSAEAILNVLYQTERSIDKDMSTHRSHDSLSVNTYLNHSIAGITLFHAYLEDPCLT